MKLMNLYWIKKEPIAQTLLALLLTPYLVINRLPDIAILGFLLFFLPLPGLQLILKFLQLYLIFPQIFI